MVWILKLKVASPSGMVTCWIGPLMVLMVGKMTLSLEAESITTAPPAGAAAVSVTVAVVGCPPFTEVGFTVIVLSVAGVDELEEELEVELELDVALELPPQAARPPSAAHSRLPTKKRLTRSIHSPRAGVLANLLIVTVRMLAKKAELLAFAGPHSLRCALFPA